jgi:hypothetical protein
MSKKSASKISYRHTELIDLSNYDLNRLFIDNVVENEIKQGNKTIKYYNIQLGSRNDSGVGEFVFDIPYQAHSFGVEEFQNEKGQVTNHSVSLSLVDASNPTEEQLALVKQFTAVVEKIKAHLISVKKEIKRPTLDASELKKFNPMRQSLDEDGQPKGDAWYFSPKLMSRKVYKKEDGIAEADEEFELKIETKFYLEDQFDAKGEPLEISPLEFLNKKHFKFRGSIKLDKVYIGSVITLQCKVYDGVVQHVENKRKRLCRIGAPSSSGVAAHDDDDVLLLEDE